MATHVGLGVGVVVGGDGGGGGVEVVVVVAGVGVGGGGGGGADEDDAAAGAGGGGGGAPPWTASRPCTTSSALSCWPAPVVPSQLSIVHLVPHVVPPGPSEQLDTAPVALAVMRGAIWSASAGRTPLVAAR